MAERQWRLVIHGGAGSMRRDRVAPEQDQAARAGLEEALEAGAALLDNGEAALDAV